MGVHLYSSGAWANSIPAVLESCAASTWGVGVLAMRVQKAQTAAQKAWSGLFRDELGRA